MQRKKYHTYIRDIYTIRTVRPYMQHHKMHAESCNVNRTVFLT